MTTLKALAWLVVPLIGLLELVGQFHVSNSAPTLDEWRGVRGDVAALAKPGDLVVVAPRWAEPNARLAFGEGLMPLEHVARADESRFHRVVEVSILGEAAPELSEFREVEEKRVGKFSLRVLENPNSARPTFDFVKELPRATVADLGPGDAATPCAFQTNAHRSAGGLHGHAAFPEQRHVCPGGDYHFAGVTVVEDEQWRPRRCIWAHPIEGKTFSVRYDAVPLGEVIRGYATLPWWWERELKGAPVEMEVLVDGEPVGTFVHRDGDGWKPFEFATQSKGRTAAVEFRIRASKTKERQFCFVADTR